MGSLTGINPVLLALMVEVPEGAVALSPKDKPATIFMHMETHTHTHRSLESSLAWLTGTDGAY